MDSKITTHTIMARICIDNTIFSCVPFSGSDLWFWINQVKWGEIKRYWKKSSKFQRNLVSLKLPRYHRAIGPTVAAPSARRWQNDIVLSTDPPLAQRWQATHNSICHCWSNGGPMVATSQQNIWDPYGFCKRVPCEFLMGNPYRNHVVCTNKFHVITRWMFPVWSPYMSAGVITQSIKSVYYHRDI